MAVAFVEPTSQTGDGKPLFRLYCEPDSALRKFAGRLGLCPKNLQSDSRGEYYLVTPGWRNRAIREGAVSKDGETRQEA